MKRRGGRLVIVVDRALLRPALAVALLCVLALTISSETLQLTTTYPSPVGIYNYLITTGNAGASVMSTTLARNAGNVLLAPAATNASGKIGLRTSSPVADVDVNGTLGIGRLASDPAAGNSQAGMVYFNSNTQAFRGFKNGAWSDLTSSGVPSTAIAGICSDVGWGLCGDPTYSFAPQPPAYCTGSPYGAVCACPGGYSRVSTGSGTDFAGFTQYWYACYKN